MKKKLFAMILCLAILVSSVAGLSEVSFAEGEKTFTVTKRSVSGSGTESEVGEYDTLFDAFGACPQNDQSNEYVITVNKDYDIPENEGVWSRQHVNIILKSAEGNKFTLKRKGTRLIFYVSDGCKMLVKNVILDGNNDGELTFLSVNGELTLGNGTVVQNFIDVPSYDGPAIHMTGSTTLNVEDGAIIQNNTSNTQGGVIQAYKGTTVNISGGTFKNNKSNTSDGGAIAAYGTLNITGGTFEDNEAKKTSGAIFIGRNNSASISNAKFIKNKASTGGAIYSSKDFSVSNTTFENNEAVWGGAIFASKKLTLDNSTFKNNKVNSAGGAVYLQGEAEIKNSTFEGNKAEKDGGAIFTSDKKYANTINASIDYQNLDIDENTKFIKNKASGYFNPPENVDKLTNIKSKVSSFTGTKKINPDSPLNNYDINYKRDIVVTYDPNDGNEVVKEKHAVQSLNDYEIKSPNDLNFTNTAKFLGWSEDKNAVNPDYHAGQKLNLTGNLYLYAIWKKSQTPTPAPNALILTLDENYAHGKITNYEVMQGEFIDPYLYTPRRRGYVFEGWSYSRDRMREVRKGDQVYTSTVLYAMWTKRKAKAEEAPEEPEEIKGLTHKAYIFGYPDGTVRPNGKITRAEAAAMLARLLDIEATGSAEAPSFPDTPSSWYNKAINAVVARGIMQGYPDGTFRPNSPITRAEFTKMIAVIDNKPYGTAPFADVIGHWAERPIGAEYQAGRILGYPDGTFRPDAHITRCEAAVILNKIFERNFDNISLIKCKNPQMIKYFIDLDASFWGYNDMVEATNTHEYIRRVKGRVEEDWLLIK